VTTHTYLTKPSFHPHFEVQVMGVFTSKPNRPDLHHVPTPEDVFTVRRYLLAKLPAELANIILDEAHYWPKVSYGLLRGVEWSISGRNADNFDASICCLLTPRLNEWIMTNGAPSHKIKAVCFTIVSHDQGWASENDFAGTFRVQIMMMYLNYEPHPKRTGRYEGSWTWFEAAIVRNLVQDVLYQGLLETDEQVWQSLGAQREDVDSPWTIVKNPDSGAHRWHVQSNIRAHSEAVRHR